MTSPTTNLSIVICAYTEARWDALVASVASVQHQTRTPREILVVVDHNPALQTRAEQAFPDLTVLANRGARGLSDARNTGIAAATGEGVAFIDEDAVAFPDWLACLELAYSDPNVLGAGGAIRPAWQTARPAWFPQEFDWVVGCTYRGMPTETRAVRNLIGCNMSFRHSTLSALGGFRRGMGRIGTLPLGCEETELCIRLHQHFPQGLLLYEPRARVKHQVPAARANWHYFTSRCYAEGISKAQVSHFVGSSAGLSTERTFTTQTLPRGVMRNLASGIRHANFGKFVRAAAILAGLGITTAGYLARTVSTRVHSPQENLTLESPRAQATIK